MKNEDWEMIFSEETETWQLNTFLVHLELFQNFKI